MLLLRGTLYHGIYIFYRLLFQYRCEKLPTKFFFTPTLIS